MSALVGLAAVGVGRIQGGWPFVWAAYGITWTVITAYTVSLFVRRRGPARPEDGR